MQHIFAFEVWHLNLLSARCIYIFHVSTCHILFRNLCYSELFRLVSNHYISNQRSFPKSVVNLSNALHYLISVYTYRQNCLEVVGNSLVVYSVYQVSLFLGVTTFVLKIDLKMLVSCVMCNEVLCLLQNCNMDLPFWLFLNKCIFFQCTLLVFCL